MKPAKFRVEGEDKHMYIWILFTHAQLHSRGEMRKSYVICCKLSVC